MPRADFALIRGRFRAPGLPGATALAASAGRIIAVGSDAQIRDLTGAETIIFDAAGACVIPGLIDAHLHFLPGGLRLRRLDLSGVEGRRSFADMVAAYAAKQPHGAWIEGGGWSNDAWSDSSPPHRDWIDAATGGRPCYLLRMDCHAALVDSAALSAAGITDAGPADPPGGLIDRDPATGRPTGILRDAAMRLVQAAIPLPTESQRDAALLDAQRHAHALGLTTVHNMLDLPDWPAVRRARDAGTLTIRLFNIVHQPPDAVGIEAWRSMQPGDARVWCGACKNYMDGSLGSRTAWMLEPYRDGAPGEAARGLRVDGAAGDALLLDQWLAADRAGLQLCTHAIGDAANRRLLELYEEVARRNGPRDRRCRVEHAQHLDAADVLRFAALGAIASMQPLHKREDGAFAERVLGAQRAAGSYRFRELLNAGAVLAFGSDWPIVSLNPFEGIHTAVTGRTRRAGAVGSEDAWLPHQNLTVGETLAAYTRGAAYACGRERDLGQLRPGFLCDATVLNRDPFDVEPDELAEIHPTATIVNGRIV